MSRVDRFGRQVTKPSADYAAAVVGAAGSRFPGISERIAVGAAADQTEAEIARVTVLGKVAAGALLRITSIIQSNGLASDVAKFFNFGIGPVGVSYAGSTKVMTGTGFAQLVATAAGNTRVTNHLLHVLVDSPVSQFFVNGTNPTAVIGPSSEAGVLVPLAADLSGPFDVILGGYFAASAPAGANIKVRKVLVEIL
jgi:hypothetical protein